MQTFTRRNVSTCNMTGICYKNIFVLVDDYFIICVWLYTHVTLTSFLISLAFLEIDYSPSLAHGWVVQETNCATCKQTVCQKLTRASLLENYFLCIEINII